jgi:NifU-like protein involved in Fe-S cluster formation
VTTDDPRYGEAVRRRMETLPGAGELRPGGRVLRARAGDREQGAEVELEIRVVGERAAELAFRAFGCPHFLAAASWLTDRLRGSDRHDFERWDWREAAAALDVPVAKSGRLLVLQDAVHEAARKWPGSSDLPV